MSMLHLIAVIAGAATFGVLANASGHLLSRRSTESQCRLYDRLSRLLDELQQHLDHVRRMEHLNPNRDYSHELDHGRRAIQKLDKKRQRVQTRLERLAQQEHSNG